MYLFFKALNEELKESRRLKRCSQRPLTFAPVSSKVPRKSRRAFKGKWHSSTHTRIEKVSPSVTTYVCSWCDGFEGRKLNSPMLDNYIITLVTEHCIPFRNNTSVIFSLG